MKIILGTVMLALALCACAPAKDGPAVVVEALYTPYLVEDGPTPPVMDLDVFTPELKAEIDRATTYGNMLETPIIDFDPVVAAQDWEIKSVAVTEVERDEDSAKVLAAFDNMGTPTEVPYSMRLVDGVWRIDDIGAGDNGLRAIIAAALRPAGDPAAMETPVRAIYEVYRAATKPVDPLHRWAPLADDLRERMETASAMGARSDTATLDFDPVVDGKGLGVGSVQYEPASSGVIVRFDKDGEPKLLVYDMVDQGGVWRIANIRAPGQWSLEQKLAEAGIQ